MTYQTLNGTLMGNNVGYIFVYANSVTHNLAGIFIVVAFYLVTLLGSLFAQQRFTGRIKPEVSFLASGFVTLGFAIILAQTSGIISATYIYLLIAITILSFIWVTMASD